MMDRPGYDEAVQAAAEAWLTTGTMSVARRAAQRIVDATYPIIEAAVLAEVQDMGRLKGIK